MDVKPGYKQTEVGSIPEDWDAICLSSVGRFSKGVGIRKDESTSGNIPCVRYGEIYTQHNDIIRHFSSYISPVVASSSRRLKTGDILFAGSGETKDEIGKAVAFVDRIEAYAGGDVVILSPESVCSAFLGYALNSPLVARQKASKGQGDAVVHISARALADVLVPLPSSIGEQRAIATALSDMDALLDGLDRLIAKKRDIKQATMQQLLTGQTRMPGFSGGWKVKRLGDFGEIYGGLIGKSKTDFGVGAAKYIPFINIMANVQVDCAAFDTVNVSTSESQNQVGKGDLIFNSSSETPEEVALCSFMAHEVNNLYLNSFCFGFRIKKIAAVDGLFFAYYMRSPIGRNLMKSLAQGSTRYNLSKSAFVDVHLALPSKEEQTAIATVLSDMDAEITALEVRHTKTLALKQAMMQDLLMGRVRLI
jgi:type I restriction enzyme S subunit